MNDYLERRARKMQIAQAGADTRRAKRDAEERARVQAAALAFIERERPKYLAVAGDEANLESFKTYLDEAAAAALEDAARRAREASDAIQEAHAVRSGLYALTCALTDDALKVTS
jgi:hypothetical protein